MTITLIVFAVLTLLLIRFILKKFMPIILIAAGSYLLFTEYPSLFNEIVKLITNFFV